MRYYPRWRNLLLLVVILTGLFSLLFLNVRDINLPLIAIDDAVDCDSIKKDFQGRIDINENMRDFGLTLYDQYGKIIVDEKLYFRPNLNCLDQEDRQLWEFIKSKLLQLPRQDQPLFIAQPIVKNDQTRDIIDLVYGGPTKVPRGGFYLEAGSLDGELQSVTLELEIEFGWKGLLVEANPQEFRSGLETNRNAIMVNTCLGLKQHPHFSHFNFFPSSRTGEGKGAMPGLSVEDDLSNTMEMQCLPVYSILAAIGNPKINIFVLDVEGAEFHILRTIPWSKVDIEILTVETNLVGRVIPGGSQEEVREYMESVGYIWFPHREKEHQNDMFVRKDIVKKYRVSGIYRAKTIL